MARIKFTYKTQSLFAKAKKIIFLHLKTCKISAMIEITKKLEAFNEIPMCNPSFMRQICCLLYHGSDLLKTVKFLKYKALSSCVSRIPYRLD